MRPKAVLPPQSPKPVGPYSHGIRIADFLFCSGQIPLDQDGKLVTGGINEQTRQVLENLKAILSDQGLSFASVVKTTVFMVDLGEFGAMNTIYGEYFKEPYPARSTVQVAALPRGARVEVEAVACFPTP